MSVYLAERGRALGQATVYPVGSVTDGELLRSLESYRNAVATRYSAINGADIAQDVGGAPYWVSPKLDGELWYVCRLDDETVLAAPNGRVISGHLDILDAASQLPVGTVLAGELHINPLGDRRGRVGDVALALSGRDSAGPLEFAAFDVVTSEAVTALAPYPERLAFLREHLPADGPLRCIPTEEADSNQQIRDQYELIVAQGGAEGLVVRASDGRSYKIKPSLEIDAVIVAFSERRAESGDTEVRSILVAVAHPEGGWVPMTAVGSVGGSQVRRELYERLSAKLKPSGFRYASDNVLYRFVEPSIVVEIRVLDLQAEDARGNPMRDIRLSYDDDAGWRVLGQVDSVTALSPVLQRIRDDKTPTLLDAGWRQLEPYLAERDEGGGGAAGASEVLRRQVWVKRSSSKTDVRKLVMWKTNKEGTGDYPAYVVHWTDYSATRKAPLAREVRLAPTEEKASEIAEQMIETKIKKGWEPVD